MFTIALAIRVSVAYSDVSQSLCAQQVYAPLRVISLREERPGQFPLPRCVTLRISLLW